MFFIFLPSHTYIDGGKIHGNNIYSNKITNLRSRRYHMVRARCIELPGFCTRRVRNKKQEKQERRPHTRDRDSA